MNITKTAKNLTLPYGILLIIVAILALFDGTQWFVRWAIDSETVVVKANCRIVRADSSKTSPVILRLDCGDGKKYFSDDLNTVRYFLNAKSPLPCTLYKTGKAECQPAEAPVDNKDNKK